MKYRPPDRLSGQLFAVMGHIRLPASSLVFSFRYDFSPFSIFVFLDTLPEVMRCFRRPRSRLLHGDSVTKESREDVYVFRRLARGERSKEERTWNPRWRHRDVSQRVMKQKGGASRAGRSRPAAPPRYRRRRRSNLRVHFHFKCADTRNSDGTPTRVTIYLCEPRESKRSSNISVLPIGTLFSVSLFPIRSFVLHGCNRENAIQCNETLYHPGDGPTRTRSGDETVF